MNPSAENELNPDHPVQQAYEALPPVDPSPAMDRAILRYARASTRPSRRIWAWPASLAAALLVTLGIVSQMTQVLPSGSYPRSPVVESSRRVPRPVAASGGLDRAPSLYGQVIEVNVAARSVEEWLRLLDQLAANNQTDEFRQALIDARADYPDLTLPVSLQQWLQTLPTSPARED